MDGALVCRQQQRASSVRGRDLMTASVKRSFREAEGAMSGWQVGAARVPLDALAVSDQKQSGRPEGRDQGQRESERGRRDFGQACS